jgi:hypothetical protein
MICMYVSKLIFPPLPFQHLPPKQCSASCICLGEETAAAVRSLYLTRARLRSQLKLRPWRARARGQRGRLEHNLGIRRLPWWMGPSVATVLTTTGGTIERPIAAAYS